MAALIMQPLTDARLHELSAACSACAYRTLRKLAAHPGIRATAIPIAPLTLKRPRPERTGEVVEAGAYDLAAPHCG
ncbi:MAG: hypothetical protein ACREX3_06175 [Gammaproteobacteria bacterium]